MLENYIKNETKSECGRFHFIEILTSFKSLHIVYQTQYSTYAYQTKKTEQTMEGVVQNWILSTQHPQQCDVIDFPFTRCELRKINVQNKTA